MGDALDPTDENIDAAVESGDLSHAVYLLRERLALAQAKGGEPVAIVEGIHGPNQDAIEKLRELLDQAERGEVRGVLFVALMQGECAQNYGFVGDWALDALALGIKLLDVGLTQMIEAGDG